MLLDGPRSHDTAILVGFGTIAKGHNGSSFKTHQACWARCSRARGPAGLLLGSSGTHTTGILPSVKAPVPPMTAQLALSHQSLARGNLAHFQIDVPLHDLHRISMTVVCIMREQDT